MTSNTATAETVDIDHLAAGLVAAARGTGPGNLARLLDPHDADRVALVSRNRTTTYGELRDRADRVRGGLASLGITAGDRVMISCANGTDFVVAYFAVVGAGAIAVPVNPADPPHELSGHIAMVEPAAAILDHHAATMWSRLDAERRDRVERIIVTGPEAGQRLGGAAPVVLTDLQSAEPSPVVDVDPDTVAAMLFTSGTAGAPRAAMLSHRNLAANIVQSQSAPVRTGPDDVVYGVLPLFHIFGLNVLLGVSLAVGATVVLVQRFDPATAGESIVERGVTVLPGAPPMWIAFAQFDDLPADTFATVRIAGSGAARLPVPVARRCEERYGLHIAEGYGLTEAAPVVTSSVGAGDAPRYGSVGRVLDGIEIRLVNSEGADALVGDVGEILVRGANVFLGYFRDPEATERVLDADGWLHTGDLATVDDDGWLYLVDRAKDLIIVSGFNVYPAEVEAVLAMHPDVAEVAVVGVPHPHTGEAVKAFVLLADGATADEDRLIEHTLDHLARYKCPNKVLFVDELPRNLSGKLVRRHLDQTVLADVVDAASGTASDLAPA